MTQKQSSLAEGKSNLNMFWQIAPLLLPIRMAGTSVARAKTV